MTSRISTVLPVALAQGSLERRSGYALRPGLVERRRHAARPGSRLLGAAALCGQRIVNRRGALLGNISELMIDVERGCVAYVVTAVGGFMGLGERLYAMPFCALRIDVDGGCVVLDTDRSDLYDAPSFDREHWPEPADLQWHRAVHEYFHCTPYWDR